MIIIMRKKAENLKCAPPRYNNLLNSRERSMIASVHQRPRSMHKISNRISKSKGKIRSLEGESPHGL